MKPLHALPVLLLTIASNVPSRADELVGTREISVASAQRGENLSVTVWYPAQAGGEPTLVGDNMAFKGSPALVNAPLARGSFPLIVMSHGSGGRIQGMSWLATHLAKAGFVVAGPNHPGTTGGNSTPANTPKIWERTEDLSNVMTALTSDPQWSGSLNSERIGVLGFSLGGAAAMEIAGATANLDAYARYCDDNASMPDCIWYAGGQAYVDDTPIRVDKVDLRNIDKARFEQSNLDRRVTSAVLVDPGLAQAYDAQSLERISIPMAFINLGRPGTVPIAVVSDKLAELTPHGSYAYVDGSVHFSFLAECKEGGAALLKSFGEIDPICEDAGDRSRADIHAELQELIAGEFTRTLKNPM